MKILIVTQAFYPEVSPRAFRATELSRELARQGHEVTVLTPHYPEHLQWGKTYGVTMHNMGTFNWKPVRIRGGKIMNLLTRIAFRATSLFLEYPFIQIFFLVKKTLPAEKNFDLMISIAVPYPVHWGVAWVRSKSNPIAKTWIADCGDPYVGQENDTFRRPFYFSWIEKWFCRKTEFLAVPTEKSIGGYFPEFHSKIKVIPQGFRFEDVARHEGPLPYSRPTFGYGGMFIPNRRDPSELLEFLCGVDADFEFRIYTNTPDLVKPWADRSKGRIKLFPIVTRPELLLELSKMHFVVNFENVGTTQTPSKLIDYAILEKPILSVRTHALDRDAVQGFLSGDYSKALTIDHPDQYRIESVARAFVQLAS